MPARGQAAIAVEALRESKIGDLDNTVPVNEDVLRFKIAVKDAVVVRILDNLCERSHQRGGVPRRRRAVALTGSKASFDVPVVVAAVASLSCAKEMEHTTVKMFKQGQSDEAIAAELTRRGYRSPRESTVIPNTVRTIRLKYGLRRPRPGTKPRRIPGKLTVPQLIKVLDVPLHWVCQRIERGEIQVTLDPKRKLYLFPDTPDAIAQLKGMKAGRIQSVRF